MSAPDMVNRPPHYADTRIEWRTRSARHWVYLALFSALGGVTQTLFASLYIVTGETVGALLMLGLAIASGILTLNAIDKRRGLLREVETLRSADA